MTNHNFDDCKEYIQLISGLLDRPFAKSELQMISKWKDIGFSLELVEMAVKRTISINGSSHISFMYIDAVLQAWRKNGVDDLNKLEEFENRIKEQKRASSNRKGYSRYSTRQVSVPVRPDKNFMRFDVAKLKRCPFCGDEKVGVKCQYSSKYEAYYLVVECNCCGANTRAIPHNEEGAPEDERFWQSVSVEQVVTLWNNRI